MVAIIEPPIRRNPEPTIRSKNEGLNCWSGSALNGRWQRIALELAGARIQKIDRAIDSYP
jgi:hypothetical protein